MIYLDGLDSIIECMYLDDSINDRSTSCDVFINPDSIKYLTGKIVVINSCEYPESKLKTLIENRNKVISRVKFPDMEGISLNPYILKINKNIYWNGKILETWNKDSIWENLEFDMSSYKIYFPKLKPVENEVKLLDCDGNLSGLGWILQQVGINIIEDTPFKDLDIIKTGKIIKE